MLAALPGIVITSSADPRHPRRRDHQVVHKRAPHQPSPFVHRGVGSRLERHPKDVSEHLLSP